MKRIFSFLVLISLVNFLGCAPLIIGGAVGVLGGYAIGTDTIQGDTDTPYDNLWNSVLAVSNARGTIKQEDHSQGFIELEAESSHVWIRLSRLTRATTRLRVAVRKHHFPNLGLAQDLFVKIMEGAK